MRKAVTVCAVAAMLVLAESLVAPRGPAEDPDELLRQASRSLGDEKSFSAAVILTARAARALERRGDLTRATETRAGLFKNLPTVALVGDPAVVEQADRLVNGARRLGRNDWLAEGLVARATLALTQRRAGAAAADAREAADLAAQLGLPSLQANATVLLQWAEVRGGEVPGCEARIAAAIQAMSEQPLPEAEPTGVVALRTLSSAALAYGRGDLATEAALATAERAEVLREPQSCEGSYESLGILLRRDCPPDRRGAFTGRALEALDRVSNPALRARSAVSLAEAGPACTAIADYLDRVLIGWSDRDPAITGRALACVARTRAATGEPEAAAACAARARPDLLGPGITPTERVELAAKVAWAAASSGRYDGSVALVSGVLDLLPADAHKARVDCAVQLAQLRWSSVGRSATPDELARIRLGCAADMASVDEDLDQLDTNDPNQVWSMEVASDVLIRIAGNARRAVEVLSHAGEQATALDRPYTKRTLDIALIRAYVALGERDEAARLATRYVEEGGMPSQPWAYELIAQLVRGDEPSCEPGQAPPAAAPTGASGLPQP